MLSIIGQNKTNMASLQIVSELSSLQHSFSILHNNIMFNAMYVF